MSPSGVDVDPLVCQAWASVTFSKLNAFEAARQTTRPVARGSRAIVWACLGFGE